MSEIGGPIIGYERYFRDGKGLEAPAHLFDVNLDE
jgi:hypothetical protein